MEIVAENITALQALTHEIKNPTALALAYTGLIRQTKIPEVQPYCRMLERTLESITEITNEILGVMEQKEQEDFFLDEVVSDVVREYSQAWPMIDFNIARTENISITGEKSYARIIFTNLIKNAIESSATAINVTAHAVENAAIITISDNGRGFGYAVNGTGLGLGICRWILSQKGGELSIEETSKSGGCTAKIFLPFS